MSRHRVEVEGALHLDLNEPFWELDGSTDFPSVLRALIDLVPGGSILYFEDGCPDGKLLGFLESHRIEPQSRVGVGTLWPHPLFYHMPATAENLSGLADLMEYFATPELADHFHVYCDNRIIVEWHDAFSQPMLLAGALEEVKVKEFAEKLGMSVKIGK